MALVNRISRLFKADFHAVLDRIEEPEQLLKQAIRDMEDELSATEQRIETASHEQDGVASRRAELELSLVRTEEELDLCFASKKPDLARSLIRKKLEGQRLLARLESCQAENDRALGRAREQLVADRASLEGMKQKAELLAQSTTAEHTPVFDDVTWLARGLAVSDDEIEVAFLREQRARSAS